MMSLLWCLLVLWSLLQLRASRCWATAASLHRHHHWLAKKSSLESEKTKIKFNQRECNWKNDRKKKKKKKKVNTKTTTTTNINTTKTLILLRVRKRDGLDQTIKKKKNGQSSFFFFFRQQNPPKRTLTLFHV
jgi:hypothetical protein